MLKISSQVAPIILFIVKAFIDLCILKFFLKVPLKVITWRYIKMICIAAVLLLPLMVSILLLSWCINPEFLETFKTMSHLFSVQGLPIILSEGLSAYQLRWGVIILCEQVISLCVPIFFIVLPISIILIVQLINHN